MDTALTSTTANRLTTTTDATLAKALAEYAHAARGAVADNTARALRADTRTFAAWCAEQGVPHLPATPGTVASYIDDMSTQGRAVSTVRRYVASIARLHRAAGVNTPTGDDVVRLALTRAARTQGTRQQQAKGLTRRDIDVILHTLRGDQLTNMRDRALFAVAYDTLCRRSELVALRVEDVSVNAEDGSGSVLVRRGKTDQEGQGNTRYLAPDTMRYLSAWLTTADITAGPIFRGVRRGGNVQVMALEAGTVAKIFKARAAAAGVDAKHVSGHSTRVGAAQDLAGANMELSAMMQAGGWKSPSMPARYGEHLTVKRGAMAQLAARQGRQGK